MKTLSIVGNCQGTALSRIMKYKYNLSNQYNIFLGRPVHVATLDDVKISIMQLLALKLLYYGIFKRDIVIILDLIQIHYCHYA